LAKSLIDKLKQHEKAKELMPDHSRELFSLELKDIKRWPRVRSTVDKLSTPRSSKQVSGDTNAARKLRVSAGLDDTNWPAI